MRVKRDEFYFEPRCVSEGNQIRWYGEIYGDKELSCYSDGTVYIRDDGTSLYVYKLISDDFGRKIEAVFTLLCKIKKKNSKSIYGKKNPVL